MARVSLPPDQKSSCITTIVDSRHGDLALQQAIAAPTAPTPASPIHNVDAIVVVYDLSRDETFDRLENYWLPLIEQFYGGKVHHRLGDSAVSPLTGVSYPPFSGTRHCGRKQDGLISRYRKRSGHEEKASADRESNAAVSLCAPVHQM